MKSVYKVREAFKYIRHMIIYQYEYPEDMLDQHGHLRKENEYEGTAHVYKNRWKQMDEAFKELEEHHLDAQVEWGPKFQDKIVKLRSCYSELLVTIRRMLERKKNPREITPSKAEEAAEEKSVLYHVGSDSKHDKFTPQIEEAINEFEKWLRPHIQHKG